MSFLSKNNSGFTILELLVTMSIMMVILSVVVLPQSRYTARANLNKVFDDISLSLSEARTYGFASRETTPGSQNFNSAYGLSFTKYQTAGGIRLFTDLNENKVYDNWELSCSASPECLKDITFPSASGLIVHSIVGFIASGQGYSLSRADVVYSRPNTEPSLALYDGYGNLIEHQPIVSLRIAIVILTDAGDYTFRQIEILPTGVTSVQTFI